MQSQADTLSNFPTIVTNLTILATFIGLAIAGVVKGLKEVRDARAPKAAGVPAAAHIAAASILENVTLNEWSRSNHDVKLSIDRLCDKLDAFRDDIAELRRAVEDNTHTAKRRG